MKYIKKEKFDLIEKLGNDYENLYPTQNGTIEAQQLKLEHIKKNLSQKDIEIKVGKEYSFIVLENDYFGRFVKYRKYYKSIQKIYNVEIEKETDCYYYSKYDKIKKDKIIAIIKENWKDILNYYKK